MREGQRLPAPEAHESGLPAQIPDGGGRVRPLVNFSPLPRFFSGRIKERLNAHNRNEKPQS
jgi:hypothetical protein